MGLSALNHKAQAQLGIIQPLTVENHPHPCWLDARRQAELLRGVGAPLAVPGHGGCGQDVGQPILPPAGRGEPLDGEPDQGGVAPTNPLSGDESATHQAKEH